MDRARRAEARRSEQHRRDGLFADDVGLTQRTYDARTHHRFPEDDWRSKSADFQEPRLSRNLELAELLRDIGSRHDRSAGEVAIAWTLRLNAVTGAIVGGRGPEQVQGIIGAGTFRLSDAEIAEIDAFTRANMAHAASEIS